MSVKIKLNSKISIPNSFEVDEKEILLSNIKSDFPSEDFYPQIVLLEPNDSLQKYGRISFRLDPASIISGQVSLNFDGDKAIIDLNAEFNISPKPHYKEMVLDKSSKWCFGDVYINNKISPFDFDIVQEADDGEIISGGSVEEFSYEHRRLGEVKVRLLLIELEIL